MTPLSHRDAHQRGTTASGDRVIVHAPYGQDAALIADVLKDVAPTLCTPDLDCFCDAIGAGDIGVLTTEALSPTGIDRLGSALQQQPPWSDIPLVLLSGRIDSVSYAFLAEALGNVVIIQRPLDPPSLVTVIKTALRARQKQLQVRDLLASGAAQQERIKALNDHLLLAVDVAEMGTWEYNISTRLRTESPGAGLIFGGNAETAVLAVDEWRARIHPDDRDRVAGLFEQALSGGGEYKVEYRTSGANGKPIRWVHSKAMVFRDAEGAPERVIGVVTDITERKNADEQLRQRQREIESLNERLKRAMTETHHRVKNSLQLISAFVDMQANDHEEWVPIPELLRINAQVRTLAAVHDVLTHESKQDGTDGLVSAKLLLETLLSMVGRMMGAKRLRYEVDEVRVSSRQATSVALVANELVLNAMKHCRDEIDVRLQVCGPEAELVVEDDGPGLPPDFVVAEASNTGLALVENLAHWDLQGVTSYTNAGRAGGARIAVRFPVTSEDART